MKSIPPKMNSESASHKLISTKIFLQISFNIY
jgi:hypothetical protein